jgi:fucose permease
MSFYNLKLNKEMNNLHACISSNQNDPKLVESKILRKIKKIKKINKKGEIIGFSQKYTNQIMGQCCSFLKNNYGIIIVLIILIFLLNFRYNYVKEKRDKIGKNNQNSNY